MFCQQLKLNMLKAEFCFPHKASHLPKASSFTVETQQPRARLAWLLFSLPSSSISLPAFEPWAFPWVTLSRIHFTITQAAGLSHLVPGVPGDSCHSLLTGLLPQAEPCTPSGHVCWPCAVRGRMEDRSRRQESCTKITGEVSLKVNSSWAISGLSFLSVP
jgi:hypothetical protein